MGTKDMTHEAIAQALTNSDTLTHEQRSVLLGLVADDAVWQCKHDEMAEQLACVRQALPEQWRDSVPSVAVATLTAELELLRKESTKAERRAITFGDIVQSQVIAMRAAVVAAKLEGLDVGMQWIANTLCGPGHLPDLDEAKALGGAQALWNKETAEHEAFRAAHPAP